MRKHTYFISYIILNSNENDKKIGFANLTLVTRARGAKLISEAISVVTEDEPTGVVLNICKLD